MVRYVKNDKQFVIPFTLVYQWEQKEAEKNELKHLTRAGDCLTSTKKK